MPQPIDPFPIYKDGQTKHVHGVDYPAWAAKGWALERQPPATADTAPTIAPDSDLPPLSPTEPTPYEARKAQLESLLKEDQGWRNIERIAKELEMPEKPKGGWADAIPLILEKEGLTP